VALGMDHRRAALRAAQPLSVLRNGEDHLALEKLGPAVFVATNAEGPIQ